MLIFPVRHLGRIVSNVASLTVSIRRIKEVLKAPQEDILPNNNIEELQGDLKFRNVCFS